MPGVRWSIFFSRLPLTALLVLSASLVCAQQIDGRARALAIDPAKGSAGSRASDYVGSKVALTFDDLPIHGPLTPGVTRADVAKSIIQALQLAQAPPSYGFINAKRLQEDPASVQVLKLWRDAGFPLANHTFSHMDLNTSTLDAFEAEILANEQTLRTFMPNQDWHWLRFPFLREGDTPEKHRAIVAFLRQHGYRVAEVTLSFGDYNYNDPYVRCLLKNDTKTIELLKDSYLRGAKAELSRGQVMAEHIFGRDIKHVMLLHIGIFETVMLPHLLELLKQRGSRLVSLEDAENDSAYVLDPELSSNWAGTFLQQLTLARHLTLPPTGGNSLNFSSLCQ